MPVFLPFRQWRHWEHIMFWSVVYNVHVRSRIECHLVFMRLFAFPAAVTTCDMNIREWKFNIVTFFDHRGQQCLASVVFACGKTTMCSPFMCADFAKRVWNCRNDIPVEIESSFRNRTSFYYGFLSLSQRIYSL